MQFKGDRRPPTSEIARVLNVDTSKDVLALQAELASAIAREIHDQDGEG
jgi:hypothetical protein